VSARPTPPAAFGWMLAAIACFTVAAVSVRRLSATLHPLEIGVVRTGGGLVVLLLTALVWPPLRQQLRASAPGRHVLRNLVHATGGLLWNAAIAVLPLATVFALEFTAPAWVALLSWPLLGERVDRRTALGVAASMVGVWIILRPGQFDPAALLPLGAALCFGLAILLTRRLTRTEATGAILLWMMSMQVVFFTVATALWHGPRWPTAPVPEVAALVLAGTGSQLCLSRALQLGEAAVVMPLDFLRLPLIAVVGWALYGEPLTPTLALGAAFILGGVAGGMPRR
jgi:drug/metabolite transporter (DMT)-like permease